MNIEDLKNQKENNRNFYFYFDKNGFATPDAYSEEGKNPEIYIEQMPDINKTKVFIEGMSDTHPNLKKLLNFLIELDDDYRYAQLRLDNNPKITIEDFLNKNNSSSFPEFLYHGTSMDKAKTILSEGLKPRLLTDEKANYKSEQSGESNPNAVYLCTMGNIGSAKFAARQASTKNKSEPIILKIKTSDLDRSLLIADEDSKKDNWEESLNTLGSIGYTEIINNKNITVDNNLTLSLSNVKDVLSNHKKNNNKKTIRP